ncbi:MAG: M20/M25/M40 family metallo-hydrolase [Bacteroidales bacterium]|nr:M20/M25/M40 family metallo-hydrolase [Bacteroidales bacterium]
MFLLLLSACNSTGDKEVTDKELTRHVRYLSSDMLAGRLAGTQGDSLASLYIRKQLRSAGLLPLAEDGFQNFQVTSKAEPGENNYFIIDNKTYTPELDFKPMSFAENQSLESEVVFAGYGFSINNDSVSRDEYSSLDVKGKWVLILRGDPEPEKSDSYFIPFSKDRDKAMVARDKGAGGVIMVSGSSFDPSDSFDPLSLNDNSAGIPALMIKRKVADKILEKSGTCIDSIEKKLIRTGKPLSFSTGITVKASAEILKKEATSRNVVMLLPGEDEKLKNEYIIIGAHYDHLGMGGQGSSSRAADTTGVHHGADDNASGVSLMIELAEKFAKNKDTHKRSLLFIAFSAEEMGLIGSKYFAENPIIDLSKVNAMINLDMVGRLMDDSILQIGGVGTAERFKDFVLENTDTTGIKITFTEEGYGPSDHSSFYGKNIPVLFFSTGAHQDYHTPADTYDKLDYKGMVSISDRVFKLASALANSTQRLSFRESGPIQGTGRTVRMRGVTLGIMPDFAGNVKNGLRADFVTPGKPAALGGMKKGDIITSINGMTVNNIQDYMFRMSQLKHGQTISVEVLRDNKKIILLIQL